MDRFFIRPTVEGARLPDPATGDALTAAGESKLRTPYWIRLELRGDVEQVSPPADAQAERAAPFEAVHRGGGSYSVMSDGRELVEGLTKADAESFNAADEAGKAAFLAEHAPA